MRRDVTDSKLLFLQCSATGMESQQGSLARDPALMEESHWNSNISCGLLSVVQCGGMGGLMYNAPRKEVLRGFACQVALLYKLKSKLGKHSWNRTPSRSQERMGCACCCSQWRFAVIRCLARKTSIWHVMLWLNV